MGEIAEMMLEGILCEGCGEFLGHSGGFPRRCQTCNPITLQGALNRSMSPRARTAARHNRERHEAAKERKKFQCSHCQKLFRTPEGTTQHIRDKHTTALPSTNGERHGG